MSSPLVLDPDRLARCLARGRYVEDALAVDHLLRRVQIHIRYEMGPGSGTSNGQTPPRSLRKVSTGEVNEVGGEAAATATGN